MAFTRDAPRPRRDLPRTGLGGRDFLLLLAASAGAFSNYAPMLSVVPLWSAAGGSGSAGVGAATSVTMGATVAVQLAMPWLLRRCGLRTVFATGAVLLGAPTLAYLASSGVAWVLAVSAVRGAGFGMVAVAGSTLVAELVGEEKRGRAVGWYGVAVGLPQVVCLPLAVWGVERFGFVPVFLLTTGVSLAAAPVIRAVKGGTGGRTPPYSPVRPQRTRPQWRPLVSPGTVLLTAACALGGVTSFLPLALAGSSLAATALFVLSSAVVAGRWGAGRLSDRLGPGRLLGAGVVACAAGVGGFAAAVAGVSPVGVAMAAAVVYGLGFGALQNDTLVLMFARVDANGRGLAGTAWNMAYDAGTGIGAATIGLLSGAVSLAGAFTATAIVILASTPLAWFGTRASARRGDACTRRR
ncbi:MFS transporter [Streptomyces sp. DSM 42041]|uniref:MFS transporter n=1 Tax=Streptomyces hazeniae TaxID=3075538 RepID=A0ABU2NUI0_9ACTN|nr:MFS transporter [Streptomyces sp. DSM 42041]MDT0379248.1 MFS transporter [Streptomyces sp. DSM 42041]